MTEKKKSDWGGRFLAFLAKHDKGRSGRELDQGLGDLVTAARKTGRQGKLTYTVTVKPSGTGEGMVMLTDDIKVSLPRFERRSIPMYANEDGDLSQDPIDQGGLWPREDVDQ